jgi:hypothetical protein
MDAVIARDADRAVELMTAHLNLTTRILLEALAASDAKAPHAKATPELRVACEAPIRKGQANLG